jgi:adenine C2-methylase RlmN of 23S rRNA A2503 and tRNA A37
MYINSQIPNTISKDHTDSLDFRVQKVGFYIGNSSKHRLETTATRILAPVSNYANTHQNSFSKPPKRIHNVHVSVASQIGCKHNCAYCVSSILGGLRRNLDLKEMLSQVFFFRDPQSFTTAEDVLFYPSDRRPFQPNLQSEGSSTLTEPMPDAMHMVTSVSVHGHGEPLDNPYIFEFLEFLNEHYESSFFPLNSSMVAHPPPLTSISTVGILKPLDRILREHPKTSVTWTLNTPFPKQRLKLMNSVEEKNPLIKVLSLFRSALNENPDLNISIGYLLLRDFNDSPEHLYEMIALLKELRVPISLVEFHPVAPFPRPRIGLDVSSGAFIPHTGDSTKGKSPSKCFSIFEPSSSLVLEHWKRELSRHDIFVTAQQYFEFPPIK